MGWFVAIVAAVGITPVAVITLWAFGKEMLILHKEELRLQRRTVEREDQLFEQFMRDPSRKVISRAQAAGFVAVASATAAWPFALIGWSFARHAGAAVGFLFIVPLGMYAYVQIRRLPRTVERARAVMGARVGHA
jgi:hypothetical protein